jgi:hypothetical protein
LFHVRYWPKNDKLIEQVIELQKSEALSVATLR